MATLVGTNSFEDDRFQTLSEFQECMVRGGEVEFEWDGVMYGCFGSVAPTANAEPRMVIAQAGSVEVNARTEQWCNTSNEILDYMLGKDRLGDVITQVKVWFRTF